MFEEGISWRLLTQLTCFSSSPVFGVLQTQRISEHMQMTILRGGHTFKYLFALVSLLGYVYNIRE